MRLPQRLGRKPTHVRPPLHLALNKPRRLKHTYVLRRAFKRHLERINQFPNRPLAFRKQSKHASPR